MSTQKILKKFEQIYGETYKNVLQYVISKCGNINDVEDIIQETYLEIYKVLKERKIILKHEAFAIAVAKKKIIKYINEKKKVNNISIFQENEEKEFIIDLDSGINIEIEYINKDNIDVIWKYIKATDSNTAKIFYLHFIKEKTFKEISEELNIKEATIKSKLYRMLKNIKLYIGGEKNGK